MFLIITAYSTYEMDPDSKAVRRVTGRNQPCTYIGEDGVWRPYEDFTVSFDGGFWFWNSDRKGFVTSPVLRIEKR